MLKQKSIRRLISNFASLSGIQLVNLLVPLLVAPYLIRTVGIENFGAINQAQALVTFFIIIGDYGFNLSATREISLSADNRSAISRIVSKVLSTKMVLLTIALVIFLTLIFAVPEFRSHKSLYFLSFMMVLGQIALPNWFFQGVQKMMYLTIMTTISKLLYLLGIVFLVKQPQDHIYANAILGGCNLMVSLLGLQLIFGKFGISWVRQSMASITGELRNSAHLFISNFSINIYTASNVLILGFFASEAVVGYYSLAEKAVLAIRYLLSMFSQAIYPQVCQFARESAASTKKFLLTICPPFLLLVILLSSGLYIFSYDIVLFFNGASQPYAEQLIKLLSISPVIVAMNIPFNLLLLAYDQRLGYSRILLIGSLLNIIMNVVLTANFEAFGTAYAVILTEVFITIGLAATSLKMNPGLRRAS